MKALLSKSQQGSHNMSSVNINSRNFNPLNLRTVNGPAGAWVGKTGSNGGFTTFSHPTYGVRANALNLFKNQEKYDNNTIASLISRHAPSSENNTEAYADKVARDLGIDKNATIPNLRDNPAFTKKLMKSMTEHEGSKGNVFTDQHFETGIGMANGSIETDDKNLSTLPTDFDEGQFNNDANQNNLGQGPQTPSEAEFDESGGALNKVTTTLQNVAKDNWMSLVDTPQYLWTLYIVDTDVWNTPSLLHGNDSSAINSGKAIVVAQQGVTTQFTLDNFAMVAIVTPGQAHGNTTPGIIQFDLFETLGFTLLDQILKAGLKLGQPGNLHEQQYILRLEFVGRDEKTGGSVRYPGTFFYPIKLNQIRSTTGPEGTRYNIIAWSIIKHAQTHAVSEVDITMQGIDQVSTFASLLETNVNKAQLDMMPAHLTDLGFIPEKQIKVRFGPKANRRGIQGLANFNLETKPWAGAANTASNDGKAVDLSGVDGQTITLDTKTAMGTFIIQSITKNCPKFASYVLENQKIGDTPHIVCTPTVRYITNAMNTRRTAVTTRMILDAEREAARPSALGGGGSDVGGANAVGTGTGADAYNKPTEITFTIEIGINSTSPGEKHRITFADTKWQVDKWKRLPIQKAYQYQYTGLNTEVLNYSIDIESLYTVVRIPQGGYYHADKKEQFTPTNAKKITPFLEDIPYDKIPINYNDMVKYTDQAAGIHEQRNSSNEGSDALLASMAGDMAKREYDAYGFSMEIKGDPYWMGGSLQASVDGPQPPDYTSEDALITFLQYNPNAEDLLEHQERGPIDLVSSGVYKLTSIESRFQGGKFTQTLIGYKDTTTNSFLILPQLIDMGK